jgi:HNH endonuclease
MNCQQCGKSFTPERPKRSKGWCSHRCWANRRGRFDEYVPMRPVNGCWLWIGSQYSRAIPYGRVQVDGKRIRAHRWSWILHYGAIPDGLNVLHRCDTPKCVRPDHLFLGSHRDNVTDMVQKDHQVKGERQWCARLTAEQVREMRASADSHAVIARRLGVSKGTIAHARSGRNWKHVEAA